LLLSLLLQPGMLLPLMKESRGSRQVPRDGPPSELLGDESARPKITINPTITRGELLLLLMLLWLLLLLGLGLGRL
jgi:hypothetical protein